MIAVTCRKTSTLPTNHLLYLRFEAPKIQPRNFLFDQGSLKISETPIPLQHHPPTPLYLQSRSALFRGLTWGKSTLRSSIQESNKDFVLDDHGCLHSCLWASSQPLDMHSLVSWHSCSTHHLTPSWNPGPCTRFFEKGDCRKMSQVKKWQVW